MTVMGSFFKKLANLRGIISRRNGVAKTVPRGPRTISSMGIVQRIRSNPTAEKRVKAIATRAKK